MNILFLAHVAAPSPIGILTQWKDRILQYMFLSLWRLSEHSYSLKAAFITMASINSIYCIYWDIVNDWSLSPTALRPTLAYRKHRWWYYAAMMEDMVLRFVWVGYVIFPRDYQVQHSSLISFMIAMLEIFRRGVWVSSRFSPAPPRYCNNAEICVPPSPIACG